MKKNITILGIVACAIMLIGCGSRTKETVKEVIDKNSGDMQDVTKQEAVTLDWYINYSWFVTKWGGNLVSDTITDETGVSINFITPMGNEEEKLNSLIASDTLPDLITLGWWEPQVSEMIASDMVYALNELADEYDPLFYEVSDETVVNWYTQPDGNIYCYPNSCYTPKDLEEHDNIAANQTFLVRKDIYEAIGSPDMSTQEGFYQAIVDAARMFPEVNGQPLIPIGAHVFDETGCVSFDQYLQNFLAVPREKDGKYYDRNTDPEYLSWMKMFRRLGEEGYLAPDIFVDSRIQTSEKIADGRYFCMFYQRTDLADQQKILYKNNPESIYIAVDGPRNINRDDPQIPVTGITGWTVTMISKNCRNPERAIELMDYMMSEHGQKLIYLGVEGETYDIVDGKYVIKDEVKQILNTDREAYDATYAADNAYWMLQNNVMQLQWQPDMEEPLKQMAEWTYPYTRYAGQYEMHAFASEEVEQIYTATNKLWGTTIKQLLLAESDAQFDRIVEDYITAREALGYETLLEAETEQMQQNKEKLGIK